MTIIIRLLTVLCATAQGGLLLPGPAAAGSGSFLAGESQHSSPAAVTQCKLKTRMRVCCFRRRYFPSTEQNCSASGGKIVPWENCLGPIVCCKKPNGTYASIRRNRCRRDRLSRSVDPRYCSEPVCCRTRSGYVTLQAAQCTSAKVQGLPVDPRFCRQAPIPKPICCNYKHRYDMLLPRQCLKFRGTSVDPRFCKKAPGLIRKPGK